MIFTKGEEFLTRIAAMAQLVTGVRAPLGPSSTFQSKAAQKGQRFWSI